MDDHELLIRHAVAWADKRRQPLDRDLLETVLQLRDFHDASAPQEWPEGSAEHLMLVRWPSHGPSGVPDVDALVATLDSFWRFLRGTGRMARASAEPRALTKEARRAAVQMPEACQDPARRSASKTLMEFGESIGLTLDGAESVEEVNARLQQIMHAWNDLPDDQRMTLMPGSAHHGSVPGVAATDLVSSLLDDEADEDDDPWGLADENGMIPFADLAEVAADVRDAPFVHQCRRLVEWVGKGREITYKDVLRLAPAREAYDVLRLAAWERADSSLVLGGDLLDSPPEVEELWAAASRDSFRSAADCRALDRLWVPCLGAGLLELSRSRAYGTWDEPGSDEEWRHRGVMLAGSVLINLPPTHVAPVMGALMHLLDPGRESVPLRELEEWWWQSPRNAFAHLGQGEGEAMVRGWSDQAMHRALHEMDDLRVWRREGDLLRPTAFGHDVALLAASLAEQGMIEE
ncbi:hypothetical protein [Ornithinimicrobium cerasi]|uniref:hypothetical protein n=1 Tax=Ornithinimicrobium cerasi TaxID=2248773 RepID=UPI000F00B27B|nr:hypothetical protein [Ornithinimicrobium cerasi]